jgi:hypothetical protein
MIELFLSPTLAILLVPFVVTALAIWALDEWMEKRKIKDKK